MMPSITWQDHPRMTVAEYLDWEPKQERRYEYIDGDIFAMTGGSILHNDIALNLYRALYPHVRVQGCRINVADVKVQANQNTRYFYPDLVITCNEDDLKASDFIQNPLVIIEVLSPGTANYDRSLKFKYYRQIASLQNYVLVDSESISVEVYQRGDGRMWTYFAYNEGERIALSSIEFECPIDSIYEGIAIQEQGQN
jgi:Uma2 family endonuclease